MVRCSRPFEAELDDNGNGKLEVKVRVMPSLASLVYSAYGSV